MGKKNTEQATNKIFQEGICPACGKPISYTGEQYPWSEAHAWICENCNAIGSEFFDEDENGLPVFSGNHNYICRIGAVVKEVIGKKHYEGIVDITDPCYDKSVWCRMTAEVKAGTYDCVIWKQDWLHVHNKAEMISTEVAVIGIYLNGNIPMRDKMEQIGTIGVDAGLAGFFMNKPDYTDEQWEDLSESTDDGNAWIKEEGFFSSSGSGDGRYPVYANTVSGEIAALEIRFKED